MSKKMIGLILVVAGITSASQVRALDTPVAMSPFCQTLSTSGSGSDQRVLVSPQVVPLLEKVKWNTLSVPAAWDLASKVFALSGPMPAALMADENSRVILKRYVDKIWAEGRDGRKGAYYFSVRSQDQGVTSFSSPESANDALYRFLQMISTTYHETTHYLQVDRCDSFRSGSISPSNQKYWDPDTPVSDEIVAGRMRSANGTGLIILPISPTSYLTGNSASFRFRTGDIAEQEVVTARIKQETDGAGPCGTEMQGVINTYFSQPKSVNGLSVFSLQTLLREGHAWVATTEFETQLDDQLQGLLKNRLISGQVGAGTFLVYLSHTLAGLKTIPGAWDALRAEGSDHAVLWLWNAFAGTWRSRGSATANDYPCGSVIFGTATDTVREFASLAGTPLEPIQWPGRYVNISSRSECVFKRFCSVKINVLPTAKFGRVLAAPAGMSFNKKKMAIQGKPLRRGASIIIVEVVAAKKKYQVEVVVNTK